MTATRSNLGDAIGTLRQVYEHLRDIPEAGHTLREISTLKERIQRQQKTVAVFGAFSAGKSSLINALIGENVLVVSPNPTTAAITHIIPEAQATLQTAHVVAKTHDQMWDDVRQAYQGIHQTPATLEEAVELANSLSMAQLSPAARRGASFLKAVAAGYAEMHGRLDTEWDIPVEEIERYTADERHACFLQRVDIPHRVETLHESNVVLVDTPGVDSIHRRHTEVAFHYMRQADAIVFVLYYTHAFSRADKDFMLQLAGVQDVVGLNKLFVVINAVDLATSDEERAAVRDRVERELRGLGIRHPRVFELSAQVAFAAQTLRRNPAHPELTQVIRQRLRLPPDATIPDVSQLLSSSGLPGLSSELSSYMAGESERLADNAVIRLLSNTANQVHSILKSKRLQESADAETRKAIVEMQTAFQRQMDERTRSVSSGDTEGERVLRAEWQELIFHIGERIRLRFSGLFRETYHPGRFRQGTNPRVALAEAANELCGVFAKQIELECRTFSLRAEARVGKLLQSESETLREQLTQLSVVPMDATEIKTELVNTYPPFQADISSQVVATGAKHFRSAKQFFEDGGQGQMLLDVEPSVMEAVRREVDRLVSTFVEYAVSYYRDGVLQQIENANKRVMEAVQRMQQGVSDEELATLETLDAWFVDELSNWQETAGQ